MQDIKQTQMTLPQDQANDSQRAAYVPPKIQVYKEGEMLKRATVFGCSLQAP